MGRCLVESLNHINLERDKEFHFKGIICNTHRYRNYLNYKIKLSLLL